MTAIEVASVIAVIPSRIRYTHLEYFWLRTASRSSVVYAGGTMLGLRPIAENVGESLEMNLGFCCEGGVMILKVILSRKCQPATVSVEGEKPASNR